MNFDKAKDLKAKNQHLIGMKSPSGGNIDEIIIVPIDEPNHYEFFNNYIYHHLDGDKAILPFQGSDVKVLVVIDKHRIKSESVFFHLDIFSLPPEFNVITD